MRNVQQLCWVLALGTVVPTASAQNTRQDTTQDTRRDTRLDNRLIEAVQRRDQRAVLALIADGVDVSATRADGSTPLAWAALRNDAGITAALLRAGADPNATDAGYAALHAAVLRSQVELVDALLAHGADVNAILKHGTPGRRFSADYSLRYQLIGANAFWLAARYGEVDIMRLLASQGANPLVVPESGRSSLQAAMGITRGTENRRNRVGIPAPDTTA